MRIGELYGPSLGWSLTDLFAPEISTIEDAVQAGCPGAAADQIAPLLQTADSIDSGWAPTDYFTPDSIDVITGHQLTVMAAARAALEQAYADVNVTNLPDAHARLDAAFNRLNDVESQTNAYVQAMKDARNTDADAIHAPGIKSWAVETVRASANAMSEAYIVECMKSSWLTGLRAVTDACSAFAEAVLSIIGIAASLAKTTINVARGVFGFLDWVIVYGPWIFGGLLVAGLGFLAWKHRGSLHQLVPNHEETHHV